MNHSDKIRECCEGVIEACRRGWTDNALSLMEQALYHWRIRQGMKQVDVIQQSVKQFDCNQDRDRCLEDFLGEQWRYQ